MPLIHWQSRFFQLRNPLIGLLDATLHTREYVYANSFTLFSVICSLGCALSTRPRDRAIYPVLTSLANGNVRWSIAAAVKSLATIQAIVNLQYWAPMSPRQTDDTYWLTLSHVSHRSSYLVLPKLIFHRLSS
jgi:hypothetical protein